MKIYEVIDFEPHDTNRPLYRSSHNIQNKGYMSLGNPGAFGDAFYNPNLPKRLNQVVKVGMAGKLIKGKDLIEPVKNIENDGYLYWIKATRHLNNRFVPVVHDLRISRGKDGNLSYVIKLEKLYKYIEIDYEVNDHIGSMLFKNYNHDIIDSLHLSLTYPEIILNNELKQAIRFIQYIAKKKNFKIDMHMGNIMWRITGTMPQLVIVDPLA